MADHVVVLGLEGMIEKQGSFNSLGLSPDFVQSLLPDQILKEEVGESAMTIEQRTPTTSNSKPPVTDDLELSRRTGDLTLYKYYLKSIGLKYGLIYLSVAVAYMFTWKFPRK